MIKLGFNRPGFVRFGLPSRLKFVRLLGIKKPAISEVNNIQRLSSLETVDLDEKTLGRLNPFLSSQRKDIPAEDVSAFFGEGCRLEDEARRFTDVFARQSASDLKDSGRQEKLIYQIVDHYFKAYTEYVRGGFLFEAAYCRKKAGFYRLRKAAFVRGAIKKVAEYVKALADFETSLEFCRQLLDFLSRRPVESAKKKMARIKSLMADDYRQMGAVKVARSNFYPLRQEEMRSFWEGIEHYKSAGQQYSELRGYRKAIDCFEKAVKNLIYEKDKTRKRKQSSQAEKNELFHFNQEIVALALNLAGKFHNLGVKGKADHFLRLANQYSHYQQACVRQTNELSDWQKCLEIIIQAAATAEQLNQPERAANFLSYIGECLFAIGKITKSLPDLLEAADYHRRAGRMRRALGLIKLAAYSFNYAGEAQHEIVEILDERHEKDTPIYLSQMEKLVKDYQKAGDLFREANLLEEAAFQWSKASSKSIKIYEIYKKIYEKTYKKTYKKPQHLHFLWLAIRTGNDAAKLFLLLGRPQEAVPKFSYLGDNYLDLAAISGDPEDYQLAIDYTQRYIDLLEKTEGKGSKEFKEKLASGLWQIALAYEQTAEIKRDPYRFFKAGEYSYQAAQIFLSLKETEKACCNYDKAVSFFLEAGDRLKRTSRTKAIEAYNKLLRAAEEYLELLRNLGQDNRLGHATYILGRAHYNLGNFQKAIESFQAAISFLSPVQDKKQVFHSYRLMVDSHCQIARLTKSSEEAEKAVATAQEALDISSEGGKPLAIARCRRSAASAKVTLGQLTANPALLRNAAESYEKSVDIFLEHGEKEEAANNYNDAGLARLKQADLIEPEKASSKKGKKGQIQSKISVLQQAREDFLKAAEIYRKYRQKRHSLAFSLMNLARIQLRLGQIKKSQEELPKGLAYCEEALNLLPEKGRENLKRGILILQEKINSANF